MDPITNELTQKFLDIFNEYPIQYIEEAYDNAWKAYNGEEEDDNIHHSACSFDFDLGEAYDATYLEDRITEIFAELALDVDGVDFRSVEYPEEGKVYSQCGIDFTWLGYDYDAEGIEDALINLIDDEGGNFFGIDFYSLDE